MTRAHRWMVVSNGLILALVVGLIAACADTGPLTEQVQGVDDRLSTHLTNEAASDANTQNRLAALEAEVGELAETTARIEELARVAAAAASAEASDPRNIWIPPADITEDMDPLEAASRCLTEKLFASPIAAFFGEEVMEAFMDGFLPSEGDEAMMPGTGLFMRYLFCGF